MQNALTQYTLPRALEHLSYNANRSGWKTMALYGAGKHTVMLLQTLKYYADFPLRVVAIVDDHCIGTSLDGMIVLAPSDLTSLPVDVLVISSDAFEKTLYQKAQALNLDVPIYALHRENKPSSDPAINQLFEDIITLPSDWHKAGTMMGPVLHAIVRHTERARPKHSLETGSGKTTLLFSHISQKHTVFSIDAGTDSVTAVRKSPLFKAQSVEWVEGPSQITMPRYKFNNPIDFALIDGPHGYPFPELEYYYVYQHLRPGALLLIDDIHIPTITNLYNFLKEEVMFELVETVLTTAFFRRTNAPTFDPTGDGWWLQGYNRNHFPLDEHPALRELLTKPL